MKLNEKIYDRKIAYTFRKDKGISFEIALLYLVMAKRKKAKTKIADACARSIYWLKKVKIELPEYLEALSPEGQRDTIIKILVDNKAKIGARRCGTILPELCKQFGLF